MISVIIPAYNRAHTISIAIQSVLNQSYQDFEIIVVDDASTDGIEKLIKNGTDPRIKYVSHSKNRGAAAARNTGIKAAQGEYIAFLDSDDEWSKQKLELQLEFLNNQAKEVLVTCTGYILNLLDDGKQKLRDLKHHQDINQSILFDCDISPGSTMLVKKRVFNEVGYFDEELKRLEDWDWLLRYRSIGKIALLHQLLAIINNKRGREGTALEYSISRFIPKHRISFQPIGFFKKRQVLASIWMQAAGTYRREKNYFKTLLTLIKAHLWDPTILIKYTFRKSLLDND